jgi:hypothetical protein
MYKSKSSFDIGVATAAIGSSFPIWNNKVGGTVPGESRVLVSENREDECRNEEIYGSQDFLPSERRNPDIVTFNASLELSSA